MKVSKWGYMLNIVKMLSGCLSLYNGHFCYCRSLLSPHRAFCPNGQIKGKPAIPVRDILRAEVRKVLMCRILFVFGFFCVKNAVTNIFNYVLTFRAVKVYKALQNRGFWVLSASKSEFFECFLGGKCIVLQ